jgi:nitrate/nitrite transporter NarK
MSEPIRTKHEPHPLYRWTVLLFISLAMFGNYYVYDSISPLADMLKSQLSFSDKDIGLLNAIYSLPNIIMVFIGGIIIDRIGAKRASFLFAAFCMVGAIVTTLSGQLTTMATGRLIFGLGAESLIVAITTVIAKWFKGKELSFAFGLNLTISRLGTFAALNSPSWAESFYVNWQQPLLISVAAAIISLLSVVIYFSLESSAERRYTLGRADEVDKITISDVTRLNVSFWFVCLLCVTFYSAVFPFQTFAVKFFQEHHGISRPLAGFTTSIIIFFSMVGTPFFGLLIDKIGRRASLMMFGSLLLVPVYLMLYYGPMPHPAFMMASQVMSPLNVTFFYWPLAGLNPILPMILMGVAFSLVPAAMWPSVALIVKEKRLGTAYGLMTMIQNIGLAGFNLAIGVANDATAGYAAGMWIFSMLGFAGMFFSYLLKRMDARHSKHALEFSTLEHPIIQDI